MRGRGLFLLLCSTAVCTAVFPLPRAAPVAPPACFAAAPRAGARSLPFCAGAGRRQCGRRRAHTSMVAGGGLTGADEPAGGGGTKDSRFVSRKLSDALDEMPYANAQVAERTSKRAWVRSAASRVVTIIIAAPRSLTQRLFPGPEIPPLMGQEAEIEAARDMRLETEQSWRTGAGSSVPVGTVETAGLSQSQRLAAEARLENERVFDLLDKYSQRHSNGTVPVTATISQASERKPLKKSKYADLGTSQQAEVKKSKSGKVLQKSKYADLWSAQDEVLGKSGARPSAQDLRSDEGSSSKPAEPPSRLEQLMSRYNVCPATAVSSVLAAETALRVASSGCSLPSRRVCARL